MKAVTRTLIAVAAALMIAAVPVSAVEDEIGQQEQVIDRDECLLVAINCPSATDSIQERIQRIQDEINRGTDVYSNDELRILNNKLDEAKRFLEFEMTNGGA